MLMVVVGSMAVYGAGACGATEGKKSMGVHEEAHSEQITTVLCPEGTNRVMAVQWDGKRFPIVMEMK